MPFFFLVSGMLHKYSGKMQIRKYVKTLIVPTCFFVGTFFIYSSLFYQHGLFGFKSSIPQELVGNSLLATLKNYFLFSVDGIKNGIYIPDGPCWFLIALFYCKVMTDCVNKQPVLCLLIWCILFYVLCLCRNRYFFLANAVMAMPFYYCGFVAKKYLPSLVNIKYTSNPQQSFKCLFTDFLNRKHQPKNCHPISLVSKVATFPLPPDAT